MSSQVAEQRVATTLETSDDAYSLEGSLGASISEVALYAESVTTGGSLPDSLAELYRAYSRLDMTTRARHLVEGAFRRTRGWDDEGAAPTDSATAERVVESIRLLIQQNIGLPTISPLVTGGLALEWSRFDADVTVEFDPSRELHAYVWTASPEYEWEGALSEAPAVFHSTLRTFSVG